MTHTGHSPRITRPAGAFLRAVGKAIAPVRPVPCGLALGAIALAYLGHSTSGQPLELASRRPTATRVLTAKSLASCPLSAGQQVQAVEAFRGFAPVFREPRCLNCHGAVNPFAENGGHLGGYVDIREEAREWLRRNPAILPAPNAFDQEMLSRDLPRIRQVAESQQPITDNDFIRANAFTPMRAACKECHIDAWIIPLKKNQFVGRTDEELCAHLKTSELTSPADRFLQHIQDDELIRVAFKGTRGLESGVTPQPPAMSFATLEKFANAWVDAMGARFHEPPDCGCVKPKFELTMKTEVKGTSQGMSLTGEASATVPLAADSSGVAYRGEAPLQHGRYTFPSMPRGCNVAYNATGGVLVVKEARLGAADDGRMTITLMVNPTNSGGTMTLSCPRVPGPVTVPLFPLSQEWRFVHEPDRAGLDYRFDQFDTPTGASSEGVRTLVGRKEMSRTTQREGVTVTAKTTFELWSVPDPPK